MSDPTTGIWPQRVRFRSRMKGYQDRTGHTQEQIVTAIGISLDHLRNTIYRKNKKLSIEAIQSAAALFGCSITEFVDDPGEVIPPIDSYYLIR